jgi:sugar phosphate isomerase/epimerase
MQLGFVSAILHDLNLEEVLAFARDEGFACVEVMCWPPGGAERRYAGVTHFDATGQISDKVKQARDLTHKYGVSISGLGYYPNPLHPDPEHRKVVGDHLR